MKIVFISRWSSQKVPGVFVHIFNAAPSPVYQLWMSAQQHEKNPSCKGAETKWAITWADRIFQELVICVTVSESREPPVCLLVAFVFKNYLLKSQTSFRLEWWVQVLIHKSLMCPFVFWQDHTGDVVRLSLITWWCLLAYVKINTLERQFSIVLKLSAHLIFSLNIFILECAYSEFVLKFSIRHN